MLNVVIIYRYFISRYQLTNEGKHIIILQTLIWMHLYLLRQGAYISITDRYHFNAQHKHEAFLIIILHLEYI